MLIICSRTRQKDFKNRERFTNTKNVSKVHQGLKGPTKSSNSVKVSILERSQKFQKIFEIVPRLFTTFEIEPLMDF